MYCNEFDQRTAAWLGNLFPEAEVDARSITDVHADDVARFRRVHFFAGIGGWEYALRLADWPAEREVWTGSCPCQPFSSAGKRLGVNDERHLWPEFRRLIAERRPATVFGEQVAERAGRAWLAGVRADLEALGYAVGAADLCAAGVGAPQRRQRLFWVANTGRGGRFLQRKQVRYDAIGCVPLERVVHAEGDGRHQGRSEPARQERQAAQRSGDAGGVELPASGGREGRNRPGVETPGTWSGCKIALFRDGTMRRISAKRRELPLVNGVPRDMEPVIARLRELGHDAKGARRIVREARGNRVAQLRGYGNAIVPQLAAVFVRCFLDAESDLEG